MKHHIKSPEEMKKLWAEFAKQHKRVLLHGDLGAGKTLFTKGYVEWLNIKDTVQSPTYAYLNVYDEKVLHIDMYRIEEHEELVEKWIIDQITQYEHVVIEWPKYIDSLPFEDFVEILITKVSETERMVEVLEQI